MNVYANQKQTHRRKKANLWLAKGREKGRQIRDMGLREDSAFKMSREISLMQNSSQSFRFAYSTVYVLPVFP